MKRVLIAGIGNVLLGDDGVGPYVVRALDAAYSFPEGVALEDLGTPALDFIDHLAGLDALIVVDAANNGEIPGTVTLYSKADLLRHAPGVRMDTHSPALTESLVAADVFFGVSPTEVLLVGVSGGSYRADCTLSDAVQAGVDHAITAVLEELDRLGVPYTRRSEGKTPCVWWNSVGRPLPA
jgi:hydrogenase maturation protease